MGNWNERGQGGRKFVSPRRLVAWETLLRLSLREERMSPGGIAAFVVNEIFSLDGSVPECGKLG